ncbi:ATP-binding cassette sub-family C member 8 [Anopheles sinensis]|uniref:ATP-binding cassette sub-family C member 8 n=1 Tax=Anopheles sinensis TaxID=74873 RepID=A0A084VNA8_ANOSI|nr:ATP-binding cassette sub-family C member 8 [Anopheles sinensis]
MAGPRWRRRVIEKLNGLPDAPETGHQRDTFLRTGSSPAEVRILAWLPDFGTRKLFNALSGSTFRNVAAAWWHSNFPQILHKCPPKAHRAIVAYNFIRLAAMDARENARTSSPFGRNRRWNSHDTSIGFLHACPEGGGRRERGIGGT